MERYHPRNRGRVLSSWKFNFPRRWYFCSNIFVVPCEEICDGAMEAYLHFIIGAGLKKHHTLMELYRSVFSITVQMQTHSGQARNNLSVVIDQFSQD
jgi:hypothetical protein